MSRRFALMSADQQEVVSPKKMKGRYVAAPPFKSNVVFLCVLLG
jgi:hypothetical protein